MTGDVGPGPDVALHPERTDDPTVLLWRVAGAALDGVTAADVRSHAGPHILSEVIIRDHEIFTRLAPGRSWKVVAAGVRRALCEAVTTARAAAADEDPDLRLSRAAGRALAAVEPYVTAHGGGIDLMSAADGVVEVQLRGTCDGCPAAATTVQQRFARRLEQEAVGTVSVRVRRRPFVSL